MAANSQKKERACDQSSEMQEKKERKGGGGGEGGEGREEEEEGGEGGRGKSFKPTNLKLPPAGSGGRVKEIEVLVVGPVSTGGRTGEKTGAGEMVLCSRGALNGPRPTAVPAATLTV